VEQGKHKSFMAAYPLSTFYYCLTSVIKTGVTY
jgi:hypothetical protein